MDKKTANPSLERRVEDLARRANLLIDHALKLHYEMERVRVAAEHHNQTYKAPPS